MVQRKNGARTRASATATVDHDRIRQWVEERNGTPSVVKRTRGEKGAGILRIDFPGFSGATTLKPISWDEFFEQFDASELAFLYQDQTASGRTSRFNKFVARETVADKAAPAASRGGRSSATRSGTRSAPRGRARSARPSASNGQGSPARSSSTGRASATKKRASTARAAGKKRSTGRRATSARAARSS